MDKQLPIIFLLSI